MGITHNKKKLLPPPIPTFPPSFFYSPLLLTSTPKMSNPLDRLLQEENETRNDDTVPPPDMYEVMAMHMYYHQYFKVVKIPRTHSAVAEFKLEDAQQVASVFNEFVMALIDRVRPPFNKQLLLKMVTYASTMSCIIHRTHDNSVSVLTGAPIDPAELDEVYEIFVDHDTTLSLGLIPWYEIHLFQALRRVLSLDTLINMIVTEFIERIGTADPACPSESKALMDYTNLLHKHKDNVDSIVPFTMLRKLARDKANKKESMIMYWIGVFTNTLVDMQYDNVNAWSIVELFSQSFKTIAPIFTDAEPLFEEHFGFVHQFID